MSGRRPRRQSYPPAPPAAPAASLPGSVLPPRGCLAGFGWDRGDSVPRRRNGENGAVTEIHGDEDLRGEDPGTSRGVEPSSPSTSPGGFRRVGEVAVWERYKLGP